MTSDRIESLERFLPALPELAPLRALLIATSRPDTTRAWSGGAVLGTYGARLADPDEVSRRLDDLVREEQAHLTRVLGCAGRALTAAAAGDEPAAAAELLDLADAEQSRDRPGRAAACAAAACALLDRHPATEQTARAHRRHGRALRAAGEHRRALRAYDRGHRLARSLGDDRGAAEGAIGAGNVVEELGRWDEAEHWYRTALACLDERADPVPEQWHAWLNLHITLRWRGRLEEAEPALDRAEEIASALGDAGAGPYLLNARGQYAMATGDFDGAIRMLAEALVRVDGLRGRVQLRLNLAEARLTAGDRSGAAEDARRAELDALSGGLHVRLPEVYRLLGRIAADRGDEDALALFHESLRIIEEHDLPAFERALTLQAYAECEARVGEEETAAALQAEADTIYRELGIEGRRSPSADAMHQDDA